MKNYVTVYKFPSKRYQAEELLHYGGAHITTITSQNGKYLLSYTNMMPVYSIALPHKDDAEQNSYGCNGKG